MDIYAQIAKNIIEAQEMLIGPVAIAQAKKVQGLQVSWEKEHKVVVNGGASSIDELVQQYKELFGQISVEVCKEAVGRIAGQMTTEQLPASLR